MFTPVKFDSGKVLTLPVTASATLSRFGHCKMVSGYVSAGAAGDNEAEYISLETVTDATAVNGGTQVDVLPIDETVQFVALCATTPAQATHVGNDYDFSSALVLDLTATTDKVFHIDEIVSAADKLVKGHFNKPALA
jgi:uncharacterized protein (DUF2147 family)